MPEVAVRVADRGELPVEHRDGRPVVGVGDVAAAEVAVDDPVRRGVRHALGQRGVGLVDRGEVLQRRRVRLPVPALELALDEVAGARQVVEPDLGGLDGVQGGEHVHRRLADAGLHLGRGHPVGVRGAVQHPARREVHDVEVDAGHLAVVAEGDRHRHRDVGRRERGQEAPLPAHVVRGLEDPAHRRSAQRPGGPGVVGHPVGQVGPSAGDAAERRLAGQVGHVRPEPGHGGVGDTRIAGDRRIGLVVGHRGAAYRPPPRALFPNAPAGSTVTA